MPKTTANDFITLQLSGTDIAGNSVAPDTRADGLTFKVIRLS